VQTPGSFGGPGCPLVAPCSTTAASRERSQADTGVPCGSGLVACTVAPTPARRRST
jgi:hypothetical protein